MSRAPLVVGVADGQRQERAAVRDGAAASGREERFTRCLVTVILALIAVLTFLFSFVNIWQLCLRLGLPAWAAPLVGPAVDLSVVGLLIGVRYALVHGVAPERLRPARALLVFSGLATLALNVAEPIGQGLYGKAAADAVAPLLLIGWSEIGPTLLHHLHTAGSAVAGEPVMAGIADARPARVEPGSIGASSFRASETGSGGPVGSDQDAGVACGGRMGRVEVGPRLDRGQPVRAEGAGWDGGGRALQREAWRWALEHRRPDGDLPSGDAIARAFGRSPRWGRLVKRAGLAGDLISTSGTPDEAGDHAGRPRPPAVRIDASPYARFEEQIRRAV